MQKQKNVGFNRKKWWWWATKQVVSKHLRHKVGIKRKNDEGPISSCVLDKKKAYMNVVSKVCLLKLSIGLNTRLWAKSFFWDLERSFCRMTMIFEICNIWGWRVLAKFFHKDCLNHFFHRARRKSRLLIFQIHPKSH